MLCEIGEKNLTKMTGARFVAETLKGYGTTHVFFMPVFGILALKELDELGIKRVMVHGEKPAAYMADGYARIAGRAGVCMAQSVGAANLAAGLQDFNGDAEEVFLCHQPLPITVGLG